MQVFPQVWSFPVRVLPRGCALLGQGSPRNTPPVCPPLGPAKEPMLSNLDIWARVSRRGHRLPCGHYWEKEEKSGLGSSFTWPLVLCKPCRAFTGCHGRKSTAAHHQCEERVGDKHAGRTQCTLSSLLSPWPAASLHREPASELTPPCLHLSNLPRPLALQQISCSPQMSVLSTAPDTVSAWACGSYPTSKFSFTDVPTPPSITRCRQINLKWGDWGQPRW